MATTNTLVAGDYTVPSTVLRGTTIDLTNPLLALDNGLDPGQTLTITAAAGGHGRLAVAAGHLTYTAPAVRGSSVDVFGYTIADTHGHKANGVVHLGIDNGPLAGTVTAVVPHGAADDLTAAITAAARLGTAGDTISITAVTTTATHGTATVAGGKVTYTAPAAAGPDSFGYTVAESDGLTATGIVNLVVDAGPHASDVAVTVGHGRAIDLTRTILTQVTPGLPHDHLSLTGFTAGSGGGTLALQYGHLVYTAGSTGTADSFTYTVADGLGDTATGHVNVTVDGGPAPHAVTGTVALGGNLDLTAAILAATTPGAPGDALHVQSISVETAGRMAALSGGHVTFSAIGAAVQHLAANASKAFNFHYLVGDTHGDYAGAEATVTVTNTATNVDGAAAGGATIARDSGTYIITAHGAGNTISVGDGNDVIDGGASTAHITVGKGDDIITLHGSGNLVTLGAGIDSVTGGTGGDTVTVTGGKAEVVTHGTGEVVTVTGGAAEVDDFGTGLRVNVSAGVDVALANLGHDPTAVVDLKGGAGGYATAAAAVAALVSDGHGGSVLALGGGHAIDFLLVAPAALHETNFLIG